MWQALLPVIGSIIDKIIPDPQASAEAKLKALELAQAGELAHLDAEVRIAIGQMDVNKIESASDDKYKSRWRPSVGWVCVLGLFYSFIVQPLLPWVVSVTAIAVGSNAPEIPTLPEMDLVPMLGLLGGMLGIGSMRTAEKIRGKA